MNAEEIINKLDWLKICERGYAMTNEEKYRHTPYFECVKMAALEQAKNVI